MTRMSRRRTIPGLCLRTIVSLTQDREEEEAKLNLNRYSTSKAIRTFVPCPKNSLPLEGPAVLCDLFLYGPASFYEFLK